MKTMKKTKKNAALGFHAVGFGLAGARHHARRFGLSSQPHKFSRPNQAELVRPPARHRRSSGAARASRPSQQLQWHACESALDLHLKLNESTGGVADAPTIHQAQIQVQAHAQGQGSGVGTSLIWASKFNRAPGVLCLPWNPRPAASAFTPPLSPFCLAAILAVACRRGPHLSSPFSRSHALASPSCWCCESQQCHLSAQAALPSPAQPARPSPRGNRTHLLYRACPLRNASCLSPRPLHMTLASSHSTEYCSQARTDALWNARLLVAQHGAVNQRICAPPSACLLLLLVALADAAEALVRHQHLLFIVSRRHHYHHPPPFHRAFRRFRHRRRHQCSRALSLGTCSSLACPAALLLIRHCTHIQPQKCRHDWPALHRASSLGGRSSS
ncbi:hypothetical protein L1887_51047 [Cichorium endivia]|nr:hypothetical protein L1887_51047 [Cichorium endivia]